MGSVDDRLEAQRRAYIELAEYSKWSSRRDEIIVAAVDAGVPMKAVATCTRLNRTYLYKLVRDFRNARAQHADAS